MIVPDVAGATAVAVDGFDSFARLGDGHIVTWGRNEPAHDLGIAPASAFVDGNGVECALRDHIARCVLFGIEPNKVTIANVTQIAAGSTTACALLADRTVSCITTGVTTDHDTFAHIPGVRDARQIAIGDDHACARLGDGTITCWGDVEMTGNGHAYQSQPSTVGGLDGVVDLIAGPSSLCARKRDGSVACWGFYRPVSLRTSRDHWYSAKPLELPWLHGATMLVLGRNHSCAVLARGLACWGTNDAGQLGDGTMDDRDEASLVRW
jgi:alpha-tubulin suppressor-like RCC1 family protein